MASELDRMIPNASDYDGYPFYSHVFEVEKNHDLDAHINWMQENLKVPFGITVFYLISVYLIQRFMKDKQPVDVSKVFFLWNVVLAVFSGICMYRGYPELYFVMKHYGFEFSVCNNKLNAISAFWATLYVYSKGVELLETVFVLLRKRLNWIHLFHHVTTFFVSWVFCYERPALGRWGGIINVTVHTLMYTYFAFKTTKIRIPEIVSLFITLTQIIQFVFMYCAAIYVVYVKSQGRDCQNSNLVLRGGLVFGLYFIYIFGKYFVQRYVISKPKAKKQ